MKKFNIAIIGATGNVGREILSVLDERDFPVDNIYAVASRSSLGKSVSFGERKILKAQTLDSLNFKEVDIAFFAAGSSISKEYAQKAADSGCIVIDKSSCFRMNSKVPLIVPEVNGETIKDHKNIIASPNCSVIPLMVALKPLHDEAQIKRIVVSTYQSVSGKGKYAMEELYNQTKGMFIYKEPELKEFPKRISFNVIPHIDDFMASGDTKEEWKMVVETKKILGNEIELSATCVRVPVFIGHSAAVNVEFEENISVADARKLLKATAGITIIDSHKDAGYATPIDVVREDNVFVSRIRKDPTVDSGLNMWIVADNLRKGAALNAVQIAELLIK
ncbi:MAG: aspartate-semialdehyde dehydrogenase [Pseudomonadota bacterium]